MEEKEVYAIFSKNWVFWFFSKVRYFKFRSHRIRLHYVWASFLVSIIPWFIGAMGSLLIGALPIYLKNQAPYLNTAGFSIALIAYGWYAQKLCYVISTIFPAFSQEGDRSYKQLVKKRANQIANKMWPFIVVSLFFLVFNIWDVIAIWTSPYPSPALAAWTIGTARIYFGVFYGILHGVITPFLLGSGVVGLIGTLLILKDIFGRPLNLAYYRRTEAVIVFITWLVMWTLIGLASVLIFSRPIVPRVVNIPALYTSGILQSIIGSLLILAIGVIPVVQIINAIAKAKRKELFRLERLYDQTYIQLVEKIGDAHLNLAADSSTLLQPGKDTDTSETTDLRNQFETINELIREVESIPNLPIKWGSVLRVTFGTAVSLGSSLLKEMLPNILAAK